MPEEITLETLFDIGPVLIVVGVLWSLIPAFLTRLLMSRLYGEQVSFWLLVFVSVCTLFVHTGLLIWLDLLGPAMSEALPAGPLALVTLAGFAIQIAMQTLFVTNQDLQPIAMWKWVMVLLAQMLLYVLFYLLIFLLVFSLSLVLATV